MGGDKAGGFWLVFVRICVMMWCSCGWIWVPTGSQRAVGRIQAGRHCGGVGWAYLVVMWHWEWDVTGC